MNTHTASASVLKKSFRLILMPHISLGTTPFLLPTSLYDSQNRASPTIPLNTAHSRIKFVVGCGNQLLRPRFVTSGKMYWSSLPMGIKDSHEMIQLRHQLPQKKALLFAVVRAGSFFGSSPARDAKQGTFNSRVANGTIRSAAPTRPIQLNSSFHSQYWLLLGIGFSI